MLEAEERANQGDEDEDEDLDEDLDEDIGEDGDLGEDFDYALMILGEEDRDAGGRGEGKSR